MLHALLKIKAEAVRRTTACSLVYSRSQPQRHGSWQRSLWLTIPPSGTSLSTRGRSGELVGHSYRRSKAMHLGDLLVCWQRDATQDSRTPWQAGGTFVPPIEGHTPRRSLSVGKETLPKAFLLQIQAKKGALFHALEGS